MAIRILIGLVLLITALLIFAATRRDTFQVQRSLVIRTPSQHIFPFINALGL